MRMDLYEDDPHTHRFASYGDRSETKLQTSRAFTSRAYRLCVILLLMSGCVFEQTFRPELFPSERSRTVRSFLLVRPLNGDRPK